MNVLARLASIASLRQPFIFHASDPAVSLLTCIGNQRMMVVGTRPCLAVPSGPSGMRFTMLWDRDRVRPRTHGGVGGREGRPSLLPHTMRMTVLQKTAKGLPDKTSDGAEEYPLRHTVVRELERLK